MAGREELWRSAASKCFGRRFYTYMEVRTGTPHAQTKGRWRLIIYLVHGTNVHFGGTSGCRYAYRWRRRGREGSWVTHMQPSPSLLNIGIHHGMRTKLRTWCRRDMHHLRRQQKTQSLSHAHCCCPRPGRVVQNARCTHHVISSYFSLPLSLPSPSLSAVWATAQEPPVA